MPEIHMKCKEKNNQTFSYSPKGGTGYLRPEIIRFA